MVFIGTNIINTLVEGNFKLPNISQSCFQDKMLRDIINGTDFSFDMYSLKREPGVGVETTSHFSKFYWLVFMNKFL